MVSLCHVCSCYAVFRGVSRWLNDGACLCIDVSVGQWSSSSQDYTEERNRALIIIFKFHSERQARVHTVEYLKEVCHWFCLGHCNFSVINTSSIKRRNHVRYSAIGKHLETQHGNNRTKTDLLFKILKKFNSKFDCLVYEMLYIKDIKPSLNTEAGSIRAKLFMRRFWIRIFFFFSLLCFLLLEILPRGTANILCIVSHFIYSYFISYVFTF